MKQEAWISPKSIFHRVFQKKTRNTYIQSFRYALTAALTWLIELAVLVALKEFENLHYMVAGAIAFCVYLVINYIIGVKWVFHSRALKSRLHEIIAFLIINLVGMAIYETLLWVFTSQLGIFYVISNIMTNPFVYTWNFFSRKYFLYH